LSFTIGTFDSISKTFAPDMLQTNVIYQQYPNGTFYGLAVKLNLTLNNYLSPNASAIRLLLK